MFGAFSDRKWIMEYPTVPKWISVGRGGGVLTLGEHSLGRLQGVRNTLRVPETFSRQGVNKEF